MLFDPMQAELSAEYDARFEPTEMEQDARREAEMEMQAAEEWHKEQAARDAEIDALYFARYGKHIGEPSHEAAFEIEVLPF